MREPVGNRSTNVKATTPGMDLTVQQHETDSPIIPVAQLEHLQKIKPEAVDWVIQQTETEGDHRRSETKRVNTFVFIERLLGQIFGLVIGLSGVVGGSYVAVVGEPVAGTAIATVSIGSLAVVFVTGKQKRN